MIIILGIVGWLLLGMIGSGFMYAENRCSFHEHWRKDAGEGIFFSIFGPLALVVGFLASGFGMYGWWGFRRKK